MFLVTIIVMNTSNNRQKLENNIFQTASIAQKYNCALKRLDFQQEAGLMSSLPIGINQIEIQRVGKGMGMSRRCLPLTAIKCSNCS